MKFSTLLLLVFALVFSSCGKQFTPATQKDVQDVSEKSKQSELCVNENLILKFVSDNQGNGKVEISSTIKGSISNLVQAGTSPERYGPDRGLSPTALGKSTISDVEFIKSLCYKAVRASLVSFSKAIDPKSDYPDQSTYYEVWECQSSCN